MAKSKNKILHTSKPTIWYYLLALFFPIMFFLVDDSRQLILGLWEKSWNTYIFNILALFMFFGIPILLFVLRREVKIFEDKVEVYRPGIKSLKTYYLIDLVKWNVTDFYIPKIGRQVNLNLKFKKNKMTFNKIELTEITAVTKILETNCIDKKQ